MRAVPAEKTGSLADRDRLIFEVLLGTGIRLGSLVGPGRGDVALTRPFSGPIPALALGARQIQLNFTRWLAQAGITHPFSIHSLRHTSACRLYRRPGDLHLVQRALGHRQITATEIHARVPNDALRRRR